LLSIAILSINLIGDAARDALDPRMKQREASDDQPILDINNLVVSIGKKPGGPKIIDGISIQVHEGETLCLVGESGSGKSVTSLTTMGLLPKGTLVPIGAASSWSVKRFSPQPTAACASCAQRRWR